MPSDGPIVMLNWIRQNFVASKLIFLTGLQTGSLFRQLVRAKADGIVAKAGKVDEVLHAMEWAGQSKRYISPVLESLLPEVNNDLSPKESQVLELVLQGRSNREIGEQLFNSERTINVHRVSIMRKLNAHSIVELIAIATKRGYYNSN